MIMNCRPLAIGVLVCSLAMTGCGAGSTAGSCASAEDVNPAMSALSEALQKAEADGKLDRVKAAESMSRMLNAGQTYASNRDYRTFCTEIAKIRRDSGI